MFTGCHEGERVGEEAPRIRSATGGRRGKPAASLRDLGSGAAQRILGKGVEDVENCPRPEPYILRMRKR
jgi:hypothetical protein